MARWKGRPSWRKTARQAAAPARKAIRAARIRIRVRMFVSSVEERHGITGSAGFEVCRDPDSDGEPRARE
jgi:hypothetical protein